MKIMVAVHGYGGILQETFLSTISEFTKLNDGNQWTWMCPGKDALLSRVRSTLLTLALGEGFEPAPEPQDVLIWLDHDLEWKPGDLRDLAARCAEVKGVVGALYPFRAKGAKGYPWRPKMILDGELPEVVLGDDKLHEAEVVGGGFCAFWIPAVRDALHYLNDRDLAVYPNLQVNKCRGSGNVKFFYDFCRPVSVMGKDGLCDYMSDDWVVQMRLRACGVKVYGWSRPMLTHYGEYGFTHEDATKVG